jgi:DNA repair protein RadA/Sms
LCKSSGITCIIIGHVTKDGSIAGPKTLEHLVDSVLSLEKSNQLGINTLSFNKHRFGTTQQLLLLKMEESGLEIVTNPSLALLENLESGVGVSYGMTMNKNLPFVVEVQSLVTKPFNPETIQYGRRETQGIKSSKLNIILAILDKYLHLDLKGSDVYLQISGLTGTTDDPNLDLAIMLSILSSYINKPIDELFNGSGRGLPHEQSPSSHPKSKQKSKPVFFARLTLSGSIRKSTSAKELGSASKKLGFSPNPSIEYTGLESLRHLLIQK